jgi:hypothetical protein
MPHLPIVVWLIAGCVALLVVGLCATTAHLALRAPSRRRVARWSGWRMLVICAAAAVPWMVVWLAPIHVVVNIHGTVRLIGWLLLALAAFALFVLLPMAAMLAAIVWLMARRRPSVLS